MEKNIFSPGLNTLNSAGIAINSENKGIKIQTRFKKCARFIFEK
jgi:hypothetical protein